MKSTNNKILLLTALMMTSLSAFALKDDTNKPINIVSDNQSLDMENSVVTFTDNVVITQGSILIKANKVVITRPPENSGKKKPSKPLVALLPSTSNLMMVSLLMVKRIKFTTI